MRKGDWKLISKVDPKSGQTALTLHHLAEPKPEVKDHAKEHPEKVLELLTLHEAWEKDLKAK